MPRQINESFGEAEVSRNEKGHNIFVILFKDGSTDPQFSCSRDHVNFASSASFTYLVLLKLSPPTRFDKNYGPSDLPVHQNHLINAIWIVASRSRDLSMDKA